MTTPPACMTSGDGSQETEPDMAVTDAGAAMLPQILAIERECFDDPWPENIFLPFFQPDRIFIAAVSSSKIVGYAAVRTVLDEGDLEKIAVDGQFRRQGVGELLLREVLKRALGRGLSFLTLEVRQSNAPARRLYEKLGFAMVGYRKNYYIKNREDAVLYTWYATGKVNEG